MRIALEYWNTQETKTAFKQELKKKLYNFYITGCFIARYEIRDTRIIEPGKPVFT